MNKKMFKSLTALGLSVTMVAGSFPAIPANAAEDATVDIFPVPQAMEYISSEGMQFDGTVNLVFHGEQNEATEGKVKELLDAQGIAYQESEEVDDSMATLLISTDKDHCEYCADVEDSEALSEEQGYALIASDDDNRKGQVTIVGADEDGAFYGVMSLAQMLEQKTEDGRFAEVSVYDYPSIKLRGYVEGFYGYPWSFEDRLGLFSDTSKFKMNTYIYAPKDDPYHKDRWRELYPEDKAEELRQLAEESKKDNVSFCWSAHPGSGWNYYNDNDHNALMAKFEQLYDLGVRQFGISYDDLSGYVNGTQHAQVINRINEEFVKVKGDVKPLIVVATRYCNGWGSSMTGYFKPFMELLDEDVVVMWTGANTMSAITKEAYEWPKQQTGVDRNLAAWWNYPVNDYCDGKLMMSPLENLDNDVDNLTGFFLNPMSQAEASKVAIISGADYSWNVPAFEKMSSWKRTIKELVPDANEEFERFADNLSFVKDGFEFDESRYLVDKIEALNEALRNGADVTFAANALKAEFELMRNDVVTLRTIENANMLEEISIFLDAYDVLAEAGIASMEAFVSAQSGNIETTLAKIDLLQTKLKETESFTITSLEGNGTKENIVNVGEKRIKTLIRDSVDQIKAVLTKQITTAIEIETFSSDKAADGLEIIADGGNYVLSDLDVELEAGGYVGFNLPSAMKLSDIRLDSDQNDALEIQYSLNGINWTAFSENEPVGAAYVRVVNNTAETVNVHVNELRANIVYSLGDVTATTDLGTYGSNYIRYAVDGKINTKFYSSAGSTVGSYVRVDLGKAIPLYDLTIYYAPNPKGLQEGVDGFKKTKLEVSTDAVTWTQIGDIINYLDYTIETVDGVNVATVRYNAEGEMARYIRFSAAEAYDNWVQVYEVEYNKTVSNIGDATVDLVEANFDAANTEKLYDGDLSTAFEVTQPNDGDYFTYKTTTITDIETLMVIQDSEYISNAVVSVKTANSDNQKSDEWKEIGILDKQVTELNVNDTVTEIKFTLQSGNSAKIYEIIPLGKVSETDKSDLASLIDYAKSQMSNEDYLKVIPAVRTAFETALANAETVNNNPYTTQAKIDAAYDELLSKVHLLSFIGGDSSELKTLYDVLSGYNPDAFTPEDAAALADGLTQAKEVLDQKDNALEGDILDALKTLKDLQDTLKPIPVDKAKLQALVVKGEGYVAAADKYISVEDLNTALNNANKVLDLADTKITQEQINDAYSILLQAIFGLREKPNKDSLKDLIANTEAINLSNYTAETAGAVKAALAYANEILADETADQDRIDAAVDALNDAVKALKANTDEPSKDDTVKDDNKVASADNSKTDTNAKDHKVAGTTTSNTVKTGDSTPFALWGMMMALAASGIAVITKKRRED